MTKTYIGVKIVTAWPQHGHLSEAEERGGKLPREGYAVQYGGDDYLGWSPKDVFEAAYREVPEDRAESILAEMHEGLEIIVGGGGIDSGNKLSIRFTALDIAAKMASAAPIQFSTEVLLNTASMIAGWLETGNPDAIAEAEQRGYNAARPLDPETINLETPNEGA